MQKINTVFILFGALLVFGAGYELAKIDYVKTHEVIIQKDLERAQIALEKRITKELEQEFWTKCEDQKYKIRKEYDQKFWSAVQKKCNN